ncbi:MAG: hypothetical protein K1X74_00550 [Pirellulales bacterium]|nr:hypothetical protein [Pirellulales bacterium]
MSNSLTAELRASIDWALQDMQSLSTVIDAARLEFAMTMAHGTGAGQVEKLWHDERTIAAGAHDDLVLSNLATTMFGAAAAQVLAAVKALLLVNLATAAGDDLLVGGAASDPFTAPWNGSSTAQVVLPAGAPLLMAHPSTGWAVAAGAADVLRIANATAGPIAYRVVVLGV